MRGVPIARERLNSTQSGRSYHQPTSGADAPSRDPSLHRLRTASNEAVKMLWSRNRETEAASPRLRQLVKGTGIWTSVNGRKP
jgi:hypothetical protein